MPHRRSTVKLRVEHDPMLGELSISASPGTRPVEIELAVRLGSGCRVPPIGRRLAFESQLAFDEPCAGSAESSSCGENPAL